MKKGYRLILIILAVAVIITSFSAIKGVVLIADAGTEDLVVRDDALHFIIRHWHTGYDSDAKHQTADAQKDGDDWFVIVEGYIMKNTNPDPNNNYDIYLVNQDSGDLVRVSDLVGDEQTPYIGSFNKEDGSVEIAVKSLRDKYDGSDLEKFCGISLSAGRGAASNVKDSDGKTTGIKIKYSEYTHLVKAHVFYSTRNKTVPGSCDPSVFDPNDPNFKEIDVAEVYTYKSDGTIVKNGDDACRTKEDLENAGITDLSSVELTKFYSANEGMHTNKTLVQEDERTFLLDLEAWYIEGNAAQIAFILDASGSMAFTSNTPDKINVYNALAGKIGIEQNDSGAYVYKSYVSGPEEELKDFLVRLAADKGSGGEGLLDEFLSAISYKICREFTEDHWNTLFEKIGMVSTLQEETIYDYPQHDKLIGYYEIQDNKGSGAYADYRTWFLNSVKSADSNGNIYRNPANYSYASTNDDDFAKMVTYDENGDSFNFSNQETLVNYGSYGGWGNVPLNFNNSVSAHRSYGLNMRQASAGFLPSVLPTSNKFTVSFTLENTYDTKASFNNALEILYVGKESGSKSEGGYLRVTREGGDLKIYNGHNIELYTMSGVFGTNESNSADGGRQRFTFAINGEKVVVYFNNSLETTIKVDGLEGNTIVFSPFPDTHESSNDKDSGPLLYLDDIFIYDTNLSSSEVIQFVTKYNTGYSNGKATNIDDNKDGFDWYKAFLADDVLPILLNPHNTAHTPLGVAAYNYFVYDAFNNTKEYAPLAYWDGSVEIQGSYTKAMAGDAFLGIVKQGTAGDAGWYYLTHGTDLDEIEALGTAKRLVGLGPYSVSDYADRPGVDLGKTDDGTSKSFLPEGSTSNRFYIDENGYLRCFFSRSISDNTNHNVACSYVYELPDNKYVKTEALQRVLANFSSKLYELSPTSKISAVKFSKDWTTAEQLEKLVLLDWTDNPEEIAGIMSQKRGSGKTEGTAWGIDKSEHDMKQYNYVLTGGTYSYTGLKAYSDLLADSESLNPDSPKFIVLFTDGVDDCLNGNSKNITEQDTLNLANKLKNDGYTIITVYLPCGPAVDDNGQVDENNAGYQTAKNFLSKIGGTSAGNDGEDYFFASNDLATLQRLFDENILEEIVDKMEGYTVKDYIDPRFDLKNADGTLWKLNANGMVDRISENGNAETINVNQLDPETNEPYVFHLSGESTPSARTPYLHFDADQDMYYLEWLDQTIPSTPVGSDTLMPVWNAELYLRAKDDFIGGNAVLTNGNNKNMNWVYHPADVSQEAYMDYYADWDEEENGRKKISSYDASSGTEDMYKLFEKKTVGGKEQNDYSRPIDEFPSKGFPRVTANVELLPIKTNNLNGVIYMGEAISPRQLLTQVKDEYITDTYYLEYIKRYAYQRYIKASSEEAKQEMDMPLLALLTKWLEIDNDAVYEKEFSVPYIYLPHVEYNDDTGKIILDSENNAIVTNNTGTETNKKDVLGILTYRWEQLDPLPTQFYEPIRDFVKKDTERVVYSLTVEYTPLQVDDTLADLNNAAIGDSTETTTDGISIVSEEAGMDGVEAESRARVGIFAKYVPIDPADDPPNGEKIEFTEAFGFDREDYVNNKLVVENSYKWNRSYKPAVPDEEQLVYPADTPEGETPSDGSGSIYGDATFLNHGRTLTAFSKNTLDVVSGDIILELRMLIGELEEAAGYNDMAEEEHFVATFTMNAKRSFTDTDFIEKIKQQKRDNNEEWEDYGETFMITFSLDYTKEDIEALRASLEEPDADPDGYVSVYAKMEEIWAYFGTDYESDVSTDDYSQLNDLPIGTYEFTIDDVNSDDALGSLVDKIHFASVEYESKVEKFQEAYGYFNELVLRGLNTTNEYPEIKYRKVGEVDGRPIYDKTNEIKKSNLASFIAEAQTKKTSATFYLGTSQTDPKAHRSSVGTDIYDPARYTYDRLGILLLSTGNTLITVAEEGALSNESFIYRITGTTLGGKEVDITVTVYGSYKPGTTIELPPGEYTVTEISDWSWRYNNKDTYDTNHKNDSDDEKYTREQGDWDVDTSDFKSAYTEQRYKNHDPISDHHYVTFEHERNEKVWLGSENHQNNHFH